MQLSTYVDYTYIKLRLENSFFFKQKKYLFFFTNHFLNVYFFEKNFIFATSDVKQKTICSYIFLNLIFCLKGIQFLLNLPTRGQRTWSNAKTAKKNNTFLLDFRTNQFKEIIIGQKNKNNLKQIILINYFNWIWKLFWKKDWIFLYKKNKKILKITKKSKKKPLTLHKLLNYRAPSKRLKAKQSINLNFFFDFIGLDELINLKKKKI